MRLLLLLFLPLVAFALTPVEPQLMCEALDGCWRNGVCLHQPCPPPPSEEKHCFGPLCLVCVAGQCSLVIKPPPGSSSPRPDPPAPRPTLPPVPRPTPPSVAATTPSPLPRFFCEDSHCFLCLGEECYPVPFPFVPLPTSTPRPVPIPTPAPTPRPTLTPRPPPPSVPASTPKPPQFEPVFNCIGGLCYICFNGECILLPPLPVPEPTSTPRPVPIPTPVPRPTLPPVPSPPSPPVLPPAPILPCDECAHLDFVDLVACMVDCLGSIILEDEDKK